MPANVDSNLELPSGDDSIYKRTFRAGRFKYSYRAMVDENAGDAEFCKWIQNAEVGDVFVGGEGCTRIN